jgi:hypothetical protein
MNGKLNTFMKLLEVRNHSGSSGLPDVSFGEEELQVSTT